LVGSTSSYGYGDGQPDWWVIKTDSFLNNNSVGEFTSQNLLNGQNLLSIDKFNCSTFIPNQTSIKVQFSQDLNNWYDSDGNLNNWDELNNNVNNINLSALTWNASRFYYKMKLETQNIFIPSIQNVNVTFSQYSLSGTSESQVISLNSNANLKSIQWVSSEPDGTNIKFKLRTAKEIAGLNSQEYIGPDGTIDSYYSFSGENISADHENIQCVQYKVFLSTSNYTKTPVLYDVKIFYNCMPFGPDLIGPKNNSIINGNNINFYWTFNDKDSDSQQGFQWQMDDDLNFNSIDYDSGKIYSTNSNHTHITQIKEGSWYWRIRCYDSDDDWGVFSDYYRLEIDNSIKSPIGLITNPSEWTKDNSFTVSWTNPEDISSIIGVYYKLYTPPKTNSDGIYVPGDDICLLESIKVNSNGKSRIYLWLKDGSGNVNFQNNISVELWLDTSAPPPPHAIMVRPSNWTSNNSFSIDWKNPDDLTKIKDGAYYYLGTNYPESQAHGTWISGKPLNLTDIPEGNHSIYIWLEDKLNNNDYINCGVGRLKVDQTPPEIIHSPVTLGKENEKLDIEVRAIDELSGISSVNLLIKKPSEINYLSLDMEKDYFIYKTQIPESMITAEGLEYYVEAIDNSYPPNRIYFDVYGETDIVPNSGTDIDINITKSSQSENIYPKVIEFSPKGIYVSIETKIKLTFNKDMVSESLISSFVISPEINGTFRWFNKELIFTPNQYLEHKTIYTITILESAKDVNGKNLNQSFEWTFTTKPKKEDEPPPIKKPSKKDDSTWLIVSAAVIVLIIIVILLFFLLIKRKKKREVEPEPQPAAETEKQIQQQLIQQKPAPPQQPQNIYPPPYQPPPQ
jgi:hypothetical protein